MSSVQLFSEAENGGRSKSIDEDCRDVKAVLGTGALSLKIGPQAGNWQAFTGPNYTGKQADVLAQGEVYHSPKEMDIDAPIMSICKNRTPGKNNEVLLFSLEERGGEVKIITDDCRDVGTSFRNGALSIKIGSQAGNWQAFTGPNYTGKQADFLVQGEVYHSLKEMDIDAPIMSICKNREGTPGERNEVLLFSLEHRGGEVKTTNEDCPDLKPFLGNGALSLKIGPQAGNWQAFTGPNYTGKQAEVLIEGGEYHTLNEMDIDAPVVSIRKNRIGGPATRKKKSRQ